MPKTFPIKLSILVLAYNVEKYIEQALDSILMQKVNFPYEIIIGDDCATDGTRAIIKKYKEKYPEKITLHLTDQNKGNAANYSNLLKNSIGTYFTVLDGDDYYTNKNKLQKQIDFLDSNPNFSICGHNTDFLYNNGKKEKIYDSSKDKTDFTFICNDFSDLLLGGKCPYIHTSALVYRKTKQDIDYAQWSKSTYRGDLIRTLFYGSQGKIKYLNEVMSVYRINGDGIYTSLNNLEKEIRHVEFFLYHKTHTFEDKHHILFDEVIARQFNELNNLFNGNLLTKAKYFFLKRHLAFKIRLTSSENFIKRSIYFIGSVTSLALFRIMNFFIPYNKW